jgi:hypothetical protein
LITISAWVTCGTLGAERSVRTFVRSRAHSGQRIPTGVGVMQSGQIGLPHDEHETPVSRFGCR